MAKFKIDWLDKKSADWLVVNLTAEDGTQIKEVSINKTNKKGEVFPGFDEIMNGHSIEGEPWTSSAGKNYLFAPKPQGGGRPNMDRIMDKKANLISEAQGRKEQSIRAAQDRTAWMWAKNNATELLRGSFPQGTPQDTIADVVLELATKIYNGEPTTPF